MTDFQEGLRDEAQAKGARLRGRVTGTAPVGFNP